MWWWNVYKKELPDNDKILLSRIYKLDRQIETYMNNHQNMSMNHLLPKTNFIKKANIIYQEMNEPLIKISLKKTKYTQNLVDINKYISK